MSGEFFDSDVVRESVMELDKLQKELFESVMTLPFAEDSGKREQLDLMRSFLEKQKIFIFRLSLSDDPEAKEMKERILESASLFGLQKGQGINEFFDLMQSQIDALEKSLDD
tara:strand:+ start:48 stop:383 length:336 start_codon:yes stop_codon:yes gene_type:complete